MLYLFIAVLVRPTLSMAPTNITVKQNQIAHFRCDFAASTQEYLTIIEWVKDDFIIANTSSKYLVTIETEALQTNVIISELRILNVMKSDEGIYTCYCHYNKTILDRFLIKSNMSTTVQGQATLEVMDQGMSFNRTLCICMYNF